MSTPHVQYEETGVVAYVTFNRPEARNAMTWEMYEALGNLCQRAEDTPDIRVLILRGAGGKAFVAGTDISQFRDFRSSQDGIAYEERLDAIIERLETVTIPTIAQINGVAAGGGCAIAAACDLRVCTPNSRLGVPVAKTLGNCLSAANYSRLLDLVGSTRLKEMLYTGRLIQANEALAAGLVNLGFGSASFFFQHISDDDLGSLFGKKHGFHCTHSTCSAADQGYFVLQTHGIYLLMLLR